MKRDARSPQAYRNDVTGELREMLETIRRAILSVAPDTEEIIEHGMLGYPGLANLAAQKHYVALYVTPAVLATLPLVLALWAIRFWYLPATLPGLLGLASASTVTLAAGWWWLGFSQDEKRRFVRLLSLGRTFRRRA